ncbi:glycosyltransferase family 2 protein [Atopobacter phocae]|uniref:glycosyltransferase family 2 protein n=1 Tax=Atopobacter phocae TaxID=136492 RepID=UPI0004713B8B|nr:glycosyltransferase [Atopobacter phocae]
MFNKKVTVLLPMYNSEKYIARCIESLVNQTYKDFDVLIINDGSTDQSKEIVESFKDQRIHLLENDKNRGIIYTLNRGLSLINGEYIIRMDSDDVCLPDRFQRQVDFMDSHRNIAVSGTFIRIKANEKKQKKEVPTTPKKVRTEHLFRSALMHPTVIMRNSVIKKEKYQYNPIHEATEDYGLWQKISFKYDLANLPEVLLEYTDNIEGITNNANKNLKKRDESHITIYKELFNFLNIKYSDQDLQVYRLFLTERLTINEQNIEILLNILTKLSNALDFNKYDEQSFKFILGQLFRNNCLKSNYSYSDFIKLYRRCFNHLMIIPMMEKLKYIVKWARHRTA